MSQNIVESESFHDNYVHGISFIDEDFSSSLILEIDHIQEWYCSEVPCEFLVAPASLVFNNVNALVIAITKPVFTMNSYLGIILNISSESIERSRAKYEIEMVGGDYLRFEAEGSELQVTGEPLRTTAQYLSTQQRHASNNSFKARRFRHAPKTRP